MKKMFANVIHTAITGDRAATCGAFGFRPFKCSHVVLTVGILLCSYSTLVFAQNQEYGRPAAPRSKPKVSDEAEAQERSQASLNSDDINQILRNDPALMLYVKKLLVRKAYEQGRLLEQADLTDDEVLRLVRDDDSIRAVVSDEIMERGYLRVRPTQKELARDLIEQHQFQKALEELDAREEIPADLDTQQRLRTRNSNSTGQSSRVNSSATSSQKSPLETQADKLANPVSPSVGLLGTIGSPRISTDSSSNNDDKPKDSGGLMTGAGQSAGASNLPRIKPEDLSALLAAKGAGGLGSAGI